ncbi:hypothetical protein [Enterobacter asburiae]|uniref:hypothetical protein n=1 Tax=Enterobacter asburiae TaxID=61645 RepID=UPI0021CF40A9|nr:hypothetical protein [Enterobacter asburiae]MCU6240794.1 hypothetical protein [Enterobacter asburiae]
MVAKSVVEIDVQDEKFQNFLEKFADFQKAMTEIPAAWQSMAGGASAVAQQTEKASQATSEVADNTADAAEATNELAENTSKAAKSEAALGRERDASGRFLKASADSAGEVVENTTKSAKAAERFNKETDKVKKNLDKANKDAKSFAGHIKEATSGLLSWGGVLGVFSGLAGVGSLWGLSHLAGDAGAQRFTAMGLGTTTGGLNASAINYQKALGNPTGTLGAIRDAQLDLSKRWQFQAMGINNPDQDPAKLLPQMIKAARNIFVQNGSTQQGAEAYGLTNYFSLDDLNRFKKMSDAEIDAMTKQADKDAQKLQLSDQQLKQWQDFDIQLDRSKTSIENAFIKGLGPLTPSLEKLSDSVSQAIQSFLESPTLGHWIDDAADAIKRFGTYLSSPEFEQDVDHFMLGVKRLAKLLSGDMSISDYLKGSSPVLSDKPVQDPKTGNSYVPGSDDDPRVWGWLKGVKHFFSSSQVKPVDPLEASVNARGRTIADRFNNPTNLRAASGYNAVNTKSGKFAVFPTLDEGVLAAAKQLQSYGASGIDNIHDIIKKWAPSNENKTKEYIHNVVRTTGRSEYEHLNLGDPKLLAKLISAMSVQEGAGSRVSEDKVIKIFNNTGGSAIVTSTQLGGYS